MQKNIKWKALLITVVVGLAFWVAYPPLNIVDKSGKIVQKGKINLGLDLQGGMHMVLEIDTSALSPEEAKDAPSRALEIIRNRIDQFGVLEPHIQLQGKNQIIVQLPGVTDRERAIDLVGKTAHLEFKIVSDNPELIKKALAGEKVDGYELKYEKVSGKKQGGEPLLLESKAAMSGDVIVDAQTEFSQSSFNQPYVSITLSSKGGALFSALTAENVGKRLAIVLDGTVYSAPVIRERIPSGRAQISGNFSVDEANDLAIVLRAGSLPAPVKIIEERTVGPSLGNDSIQSGIRSVIVGSILVFLFMAGYYLLCGMIANVALVVNLVLILGALAYFHGTLTLPGIAGLVLTISMVVDSNVLIYERIREELLVGKSLRASIDAGFHRAFLTIFDSHVTTLVASVILFQFGSGPVRGFATILTVGVLTSMFTSIVLTKLVLDLLTRGESGIEKLPMLRLIHGTKIDFIGLRKFSYIVSVVLIIGGVALFVHRGAKNLSIDFEGGVIQQLRFEKPVHIDTMRKALQDIGLASATLQSSNNDKEVLIRSLEMDPTKISSKFKEIFKDNKFEVLKLDHVGPTVGKDLFDKAIKALIIAILCMLVYIWMRFEFKWAVAGIIALFHDVFICLGALALTHREISTSVIAAILTLIGYSIMDTIVVFDRIRENLKVVRKGSLSDIINLSINQTLSRTLLTSWLTLLVVIALFALGGAAINDFSFVMLIGIIVGTYSSVFVAAPILVDWPSGRKVKK